MELKLNGLGVSIADDQVAEAVRQHLLRDPAQLRVASPLIAPYGVPLIGKPWKDGNGIYAGMARGLEGARDYPLIVGPEAPQRLNHKGAEAFAAANPGWRLLLRHEGWLCKASVPELFKDEWYWLGPQYEADSGCAWAQFFDGGSQGYSRKVNECRVRLVRSVILID